MNLIEDLSAVLKNSLNPWIIYEELLAWQETALKLLPDEFSLIFSVATLILHCMSLEKTRGFMVVYVLSYFLSK